MWDDILAEPQPPDNLIFWRGISHYARGLAQIHKDRLNAAGMELTSIKRIVDDPATPEVLIGFSNAQVLLRIASRILAGRLAAATEAYEAAVNHFEYAVRLQDGLLYQEPPDWYYPVRHSLGSVLLQSGRYSEAETVFWQDLKDYPENAYSLFGLSQCLKLQGKEAEAKKVRERFEKAWAQSDFQLSMDRLW
jgi:tetratricopeptide (TPR) repeat protein